MLALFDPMTLRQLQQDCAHKRAEYLIARQVYSEVTRLAIEDRTALERELRDALVAYYTAHGTRHTKLREGDPLAQHIH